MIKLKNTLYKLAFIIVASFSIIQMSFADSSEEIEIGVDTTLGRFTKEISGSEKYLEKAQGVLVFPSVIKAGLVVGGEYGEGALRVDGKTVEYYSTVAASLGLQAGAQSKSLVLVFLTEKALTNFRSSEGWKAGVDGSIAIIKWGAGENINNLDTTDPIAGFVFNNKGLMYNLTLEGSRFSKLVK